MYLTWFTELTQLLPKLAILIGVVLGILILATLLVKIMRVVRLLKVQYGYLEITPPSRGDRSPLATTQLFTAIHGLGIASNSLEKQFGAPSVFTFEVESTKSGGIRYLLHCPKDKLSSLERTIHAYMPEVKIAKSKQGTAKEATIRKIVSYKQKKHYAFPLKTLEDLETHDPIGYLTSALANPTDDEQLVYQLLIKPIVSREAESIASKILDNEDLLNNLQHRRVNTRGAFNVINKFLFGILDGIGSIYAPESRHDYMMAKKDIEYKKQVAKHLKPVRTLSYFEHELVESIHQKLSEPLFNAEIRLSVAGSDKKVIKERLKNIKGAIGLFNVPKYQQLVQNKASDKTMSKWLHHRFERRLPSFNRQSVFSSLELASLYHFPNKQSGKTDNVITSLSKTLPAPVSLKNGQKLGVLIGQNVHHGVTTPIGLTDAERERHMYVIGGTGNGKTTMLLYQIVQDIQSGKGLAVVDPHGDLADKILHYIPENRIHDVVYMNPDDLAYPVGMNLLELTPGLQGDDLLREKDLITEAAVSVLRKVFSEDDTGGHRVEYVLRNSIQTALAQDLEAPTIFTIFKLLNDAKFRRSVTTRLEDENLVNFWKNEIGKAGEMQKVKMAAGITSKIGRFLFSASARQVLEQPESTIDFDAILSEQKILICNFSKGLLGDDTSTLFGTTVLAKIQTASLRRARQKVDDREPYYLYVDEFQNFATMSFVQMLSEARKYKLYLTMAEQSTSQQDKQRLVDIILANVGTVVCFRSGSPSDERLVLPLFRPFVEEGEIANLPSFNFFARIAAVQSQEPMSGMTVLLDSPGSQRIAESVIDSSRKLYAKKREQTPIVEPVKKASSNSESKSNNRKKNQAANKQFSELDNAPKAA